MKSLHIRDTSDIGACGADTIIDVRSPSEFAEDHIPGAINLPVLSDAERIQIGTIYKQVSSFTARKIGAALVAQNAAGHLTNALADKTGEWQPLVYCWRGGQRSGSFASILDQVGWRVQLLDGGYRSYRRLIVDTLYHKPLCYRIKLIEGGTGTGKTRLLHHLAKAGEQILDIEGLANHRGSLFGEQAGGQPSQKMFETRLAQELAGLDPARLTWIEAESSKVGARIIPGVLWHAMRGAERVEIKATLSARALFLAQAYKDLTENIDHLHRQIDQLRAFHSAATITEWHSMAKNSEWEGLAAALVSAHYDPRYAKSATQPGKPVIQLALDDLNDETLATVAQGLSRDFK